MKRSLIACLLAAALLLSLPCFAAGKADNDPVLAVFDGEEIRGSEVAAAAESLYRAGLLIRKDDVRGALEYLLKTQKTAEAKVRALGFDKLSPEEEEEVKKNGTAAFDAYIDRLIDSTDAAAKQGLSREKLREQAVAFLKASGHTAEKYIAAAAERKSLSKLMDSVDVTITDADIEKVFSENVEKDRARFSNDPRAYEFYTHHRGLSVWYTPAGFRRVLHLVLTPDKQALDAYLSLKKDASKEEKERAHKAVLASCKKDLDALSERLKAGASFAEILSFFGQAEAAKAPLMVRRNSSVWNDGIIFAAFDEKLQKPGDVSAPHADKSGVHVVCFVEDVPEGAVPLDDGIRASIVSYIKRAAQEEKMAEWAAEFPVEYREDAISALVKSIEDEKKAREAAEDAEINAAAEQRIREEEEKNKGR